MDKGDVPHALWCELLNDSAAASSGALETVTSCSRKSLFLGCFKGVAKKDGRKISRRLSDLG